MKLKSTTTLIILILLVNSSIFVIGNNNAETINLDDDSKEKEIRVAMLSEFPFFGWIELLPFYVEAVSNYKWRVGDINYKFKLTKIYDEDIISGELNTKNYEVLLVPGAGVGDGEAWTKGFYRLPKIRKWKNNIANFVKDGGGYVGICGGAMLMTELSEKPKTFMERQYHTSSLGVTCVKSIFGGPYSFIKPKIGPPAYLNFYYERDESTDFNTVEGCAKIRSGVPLDVTIINSHPIFDDFLEDTQRVLWAGGPGFVLPDSPDRELNVLARYPLEEMSDNKSTQLREWKYTGGLLGYLRGFLKGIKECRDLNKPLIYAFQDLYFKSGDWEPTDEIIKINLSNKPCMTAEIYPNENKGRIILNALHPEYAVWWGGRIENMPDTNYNYISEALYRWVNVTPSDETPEDEISHNWWMLRRQVAWAAKIPDNDLPSVYGASQVSDIYPYNQSSNFTIIGNTKEESDGIMSLDLYYRHSTDNCSWGDWKLYGSDTDRSDGWSWEFNAPDGTGYYQFYSIRYVEYEGYIEIEKVPPGPDAIARVL